MNVTIPYWSIPAALTVLFCLIAVAAPMTYKSSGSYDFGRGFLAIFYGALAIILSLAVWLAFFIIN